MKYEIGLTERTYRLHVCGDFDDAYKLLSENFRSIAASALALGKYEAEIFWNDCKHPLRVLASMTTASDAERIHQRLNS